MGASELIENKKAGRVAGRLRRNLVKSCVAAMVMASIVLLPSQAEAQAMSEGCAELNDPNYDSATYGIEYGLAAIAGSDWRKGDRAYFTATEGAAEPPEAIILDLKVGEGSLDQVDSAGVPGTVEYTFTEDTTNAFFRWRTSPDTHVYVRWDVGCEPAAPATADDCKGIGYEAYGFKNQGECVKSLKGKT